MSRTSRQQQPENLSPNRVLLFGLLFVVTLSPSFAEAQQPQCREPVLQIPSRPSTSNTSSSLPQTHYRVSVLAFRSIETANKDHNATFGTYLTEVVGRQFDPPLTFELVPVPFTPTVLDEFVFGDYDFVHTSPGIFSCIDSERGAHSLVSKINARRVQGQVHELSDYGGVIVARADNDRVNSIHDIKGKRVGVTSVSGFGSAQMQFREMQKNGLHHIQDPAQVLFLRSQVTIVNAVLEGLVDVGFVRTDQLERTVDARTGDLVDLSLVKIINIQQPTPLTTDGEPFPFTASTVLYPEWNVAAFSHVPEVVAHAVQIGLLNLDDHAALVPALQECYEAQACGAENDDQACRDACFAALDVSEFRNCDTTREVAHMAYTAKTNGRYAGWRTTLSYMDVRNMKEETGFLRTDQPRGAKPQCLRGTNLAETVTCPPGQFRKSDEEIDTGCQDLGIPCHGYECLCSPCVAAFDVDFFPQSVNVSTIRSQGGCAKFEVCGTIEQMDSMEFRIVDNRKREDVTVTAVALIQAQEVPISVQPLADVQLSLSSNATLPQLASPFEYNLVFSATNLAVGVVIVRVYVDGVQISQSPFRLEVSPRICADRDREANTAGLCVCRSDSVEINSRCVDLLTLLLCILVPLATLVGFAVRVYVEYKKRQSDALWRVKPTEVHFRDDPPEVLGHGSFGVVLLAEFRGTMVAIKRAIPPRSINSSTGNTTTTRWTAGGGGSGSDEQSSGGGVTGLQLLRSFDQAAASGVESNHTSKSKPKLLEQAPMSLIGSNHSRSSSHTLATTPEQFAPTKGGISPALASHLGSVWLGDMGTRSTMVHVNKQARDAAVWRRMKADFIREMRFLSKLRHPSITTVMGATVNDQNEPLLIMEYMEHGSLYDMLHNETLALESDMLITILSDITQGLRFLHSSKPPVVHGDLKASNILVDSKFHAKLADFGVAAKSHKGAVGTPYWMAPELLRGETKNTAATDIYSFGIVLYEVFSRRDPYEGENRQDVLRLVADPQVNKRPPIPASCPQQLKSLLVECLEGDPNKRPTAAEVDSRLKRLDAKTLTAAMEDTQRRKKLTTATTTLFDIFPRHIAKLLRDGKPVEPEHHDLVTIFFSDIVGFTSMSAAVSPEKVANLLTRLYDQFDKLAHEYDVFKVETIGDSYMAVTNLVKDQADDHVKRIAAFAVAALRMAQQVPLDLDDPSKGFVNMRVGFHSGPVVASVVGKKNPRYCLFGDTVNTASRMESSSSENRIQCSKASAPLLRNQWPEIPLRPRGLIDVKGKGEMQTFWVNEQQSSSGSSQDLAVIREPSDHLDLLLSPASRSEVQLELLGEQALPSAMVCHDIPLGNDHQEGGEEKQRSEGVFLDTSLSSAGKDPRQMIAEASPV